MGERGDWTHHCSPDFTGTADSVGIATMCLPGMLVLPAHGMLGERRRQEQGSWIYHTFNPIICQLLLSVVLYGVLWVEVGIGVILFSGRLIVLQRGFREFTSNSTRFSNNQWVSMRMV